MFFRHFDPRDIAHDDQDSSARSLLLPYRQLLVWRELRLSFILGW